MTLVGWLILGVVAVTAIFADFIAPYDYREQGRGEPSAPPSAIGLEGLCPVVYSRRLEDPLRSIYSEDRDDPHQLEFIVRGHSYRLLGVVKTDVHLLGIRAAGSSSVPRINLLGNDRLGRDRFSRLLQATRFSLAVSLLGTFLACALGVSIGLVSGYSGRFADTALMGVTDAMLALPTLILILAARAAFPLELPPVHAAALLLMIFALTGWADLARLTRGLVLSLRDREFVLAATASGLTRMQILVHHILPNIQRPILTQALLLVPAFLMAEIALSYLGVGLQEPEASLGTLLVAAGDLNLLREQPFATLSPAIAVFFFVLGIRLVGRGLELE